MFQYGGYDLELNLILTSGTDDEHGNRTFTYREITTSHYITSLHYFIQRSNQPTNP